MITVKARTAREDINAAYNGFLEEQRQEVVLQKDVIIDQIFKEAEKNIDKISNTLQEHQVRLMKDCAMLDQMYHMNTVYFRELNIRIAAGKRKIEQCKMSELPALEQKAIKSGLAQDAQACNDMKNQLDRLEKKIYELTRSISLQSAPQIRLIQSNEATMAYKEKLAALKAADTARNLQWTAVCSIYTAG